MTAMIGVNTAKAMRPKPSTIGLRPSILEANPTPRAVTSGTVMVDVVTPPEIIGVAYDSGGVTTSTITVPLVTALGVGLASSIEGRNPMVDGFGLIAFAVLTPIIAVMAYGMVV